MKKGFLLIAGALVCLSIPASAARQGDGAALVARFTETVRSDPILLQAMRQNRSGAAASAIPSLLSYTRANPGSAEGWYLLSMAYGETGQTDLANAAIRRATAIKPELDDMTNYLAGRMARPSAAPAAQPKAAYGQNFRPGDRVEGYDAHMWAPATVTEVEPGRVELKFDSNSGLYWIDADKVRPLPADKDPQGAQPRQTTSFTSGERVEVRVASYVWMPATVIRSKAGQIEVRRDDSDLTHWMSGADVQPLGTDAASRAAASSVADAASSSQAALTRQAPATPRPAVKRPPVKRLAASGPAAPPTGRYQCFFGTFSSWTAADYGGGDFIANLNLRADGTYDYASYKGRWSAKPGGGVSFSSMPTNYTGAQGYISNGTPGVELKYGNQGVQLCRKID